MSIIINYLGLLMFLWYAGFRWTYCVKEPWLYNPINLLTAFFSIFFLVTTLFCPALVVAFDFVLKLFFCLAVFLLFRNFYYTVEDVIDFRHDKTIRQLSYIIIDVMMFIYVLNWIVKYNGKQL